MSVDFIPYQDKYFDELHDAFTDAFSKYFVSFKPSRDQFKKRIYSKLNIEPELSGLAVENERILAFVLHTIGTYQKKKTIYNGGTGTRIDHQGKGLGYALYEDILSRVDVSKAERILLEVVDRNHRAQKLYEKIGFKFTRVLKCFKAQIAIQEKPNKSQIITRTIGGWKDEFNHNMSFEPCFMDTYDQLQHNLAHELIIEATSDEQIVGHAVFQPVLGRISQIAVHPDFRGQSIGRQLIIQCQKLNHSGQLSILNIPESEIETIEALEKIGFVNELDQFELELII